MGRTDSKIVDGLTWKHEKKKNQVRNGRTNSKNIRTNLETWESLARKIRTTDWETDSKYRSPESKQGFIDTSQLSELLTTTYFQKHFTWTSFIGRIIFGLEKFSLAEIFWMHIFTYLVEEKTRKLYNIKFYLYIIWYFTSHFEKRLHLI